MTFCHSVHWMGCCSTKWGVKSCDDMNDATQIYLLGGGKRRDNRTEKSINACNQHTSHNPASLLRPVSVWLSGDALIIYSRWIWKQHPDDRIILGPIGTNDLRMTLPFAMRYVGRVLDLPSWLLHNYAPDGSSSKKTSSGGWLGRARQIGKDGLVMLEQTETRSVRSRQLGDTFLICWHY